MSIMHSINNCCICGGAIKEIFALPFEDILGMETHDYVQRIGLCRRCGFLLTMNPFSEDLLENRYKNESKFEYDSEEHILDETDEYAVRSKRNKRWIEDCVGNVASIFEVGAASGYNLGLFDYAEGYGVEPSEVNCKLAKQNYDVDLFCGSFREFEMSENKNKWELIYLAMILEHIVNPYDFLRTLQAYNSRYFFIEVPAMDSKYVDEPYGMMCEEHVNLFTFEALNNMMGELGYGLVDAKVEFGLDKGYPAGWPCIDTLWEIGRPKKLYKPAVDAEGIIRSYIECSKEALIPVAERIDTIPNDLPIAVWGTGHHVSMLLKKTSLGKKNIVKFYDSDQKKHKYVMHGKPIEAFDASDIESGNVKGIVVGTYIYQEVIHKTILDSCFDGCEVFLLYPEKT